MTDYTYRSKFYPFGAAVTVGNPLYSDVVHGTVRSGVPTKLLVTSSWGRGVPIAGTVYPGNDTESAALTSPEHVKLTINFGAAGSDLVVLDTSAGTNELNTEIDDITPYLPTTGGNPDPSAWGLQFTITLTVDPTTSPDFEPTELFTAWTYLEKSTGTPVVRFEPFGVADASLYQPIGGVQAQFYARGTDQRVGLGVSDSGGELQVLVPAGTYDMRLYGYGFSEQDWLTGSNGVTVGTSTNSGPFGSTTSDVAKNAEFSQIKTLFSSLHWPGYMVPEDFTDSRASDRDDPGGTTPAAQNFGRVYAGLSWVEYVGIAIDPSPL